MRDGGNKALVSQVVNGQLVLNRVLLNTPTTMFFKSWKDYTIFVQKPNHNPRHTTKK